MATHLEFITNQKFNSSFKNMLRDYYTYGFKDRSEYSVSRGTYDSDRKRLNDFLKDYMEWSELKKRKNPQKGIKEGKHVTFVSCDSQSMSINPFHRVYRFCGTDRPAFMYYFFHTLAALNSLFQLEDGVDTLNINGPAEEKLVLRAVKSAVESMRVGKKIEVQLEEYYNNEDLLIEKAEELGFTDEQISKLETAISDATMRIAARFESKVNIQEKLVIRTVKSMHVGQKIEAQLQEYYNDEDLLREKAKKLGFSDEQISKLKMVIRATTIKMKSSDLAKFFAQNLSDEDDYDELGIDNESLVKNVNNRLQRPYNIGVIQCDQNSSKLIFSPELLEEFGNCLKKIDTPVYGEYLKHELLKAVEEFSKRKPGDHNWYLSKLTIKRLLEAGCKADDRFLEHIRYVLDFYSKTFLFGEIGTFLLDRMKTSDNSCIRIKHEYYMHSLNDYNAIDLMAAIENNEWCLISYKRNDIETTLLCYPLELRISFMNGREYLMYYEPFKRSCAPLRLEFIESIQYYHDHDVKKCMSTYFSDEEIDIDIDRNINKAKLLLEYTWGVSAGSVQERNIDRLNAIFRELHVRINYNKDTDHYILNRIYRESRNGTIVVNEEDGYVDFVVVATDINEIIPFIRSFYARVISCTGYDSEGFSVEMDIKNIVGRVINKESEDESKIPETKKEIWRTDSKFLSLLGDGVKATEHDKLFNEIFSAYYHIFSAIFCEVCSHSGEYTEKELESLCKTVMYQYQDECGPEMLGISFNEGKAFAELLKDGGFMLKENLNGTTIYRSKYETLSKVDMYRDVVPLSEVEIRWLKTIIEDEKIHYFLNEKEIISIKLFLAEMAIDIKPFPMGVVNYYDRYKFSPKKEWKESTVLVPVLDAIGSGHIVKIKYISSKKNVVSGNYKPILVEYSKRDNCFKGYFLSCRRKEGLKVYNLSQCISVEDTGKVFDADETKAFYKKYREKQMDKVEIEFEDKPGLADRVLTEFSPWKKCCEFIPETGIYHLTVFYQKQDGKEMALRLLSLGPAIHLVDLNHRLSVIIRSKLNDQMEHIQKRPAKELSKGEKAGAAR